MADDLDRTIRIQRNAKVGTDSRGRTVWTKPVETVELELVSTQMLEQLLESDIEADKARMRELAAGESGVLARDTANNSFEIVPDDELELALKAAADDSKPVPPSRPPEKKEDTVEEFSLVTTQVLKQMLTGGEASASDEEPSDAGGGYNPYDSS